MPASAYHLLAQRGDRSLRLMQRNQQFSSTWMGLTHLLATISDEEGWVPERIRFRSPHLHPNGMVRMAFHVKRGTGGARYYSAFQEGDFGQFLANTNAAVVEFLVRCPSWRRGFDALNTILDNFAVERSVPFEQLHFSVGKVVRGLAWTRVFTSTEAKQEDTRWNATHKPYR